MAKQILKSYSGEVFFEFLTHKGEADAIIILPGFPSSNNYDKLMQFFYEKGFNVFFPRYPGSYQSKGKFLDENPFDHLSGFVDHLSGGSTENLWDLGTKNFKNRRYFLLSGSFGGPFACALAKKHSGKFTKIILTSPVLDFSNHNVEFEEQDLLHLTGFIKRSFTNLYQIEFDDLVKQVLTFDELNKEFYWCELEVPVTILHDPKDKTVSINHSKRFVEEKVERELIEHGFGHNLSVELIDQYWDQLGLS